MWKRDPSEDVKLTSFLDVIDLTSKPCCGYSYLLRMVDPVSRYGHVVVLKSMLKDDIFYSLRRLMVVSRVKPETLYFSSLISFVSFSFSLSGLQEYIKNIHFQNLRHKDTTIKASIS